MQAACDLIVGICTRSETDGGPAGDWKGLTCQTESLDLDIAALAALLQPGPNLVAAC